MADKSLQFYRGSRSGIPTLKEAEPGWTTDEKRLYVGDGTSNVAIANKSEVDAVQSDLDTLEGKYNQILADAATKTELATKQDKLTGTQGQVVGFDGSGNAVAQAAPQTGMTQDQADQRYLQLSGGTVDGDVTLVDAMSGAEAASILFKAGSNNPEQSISESEIKMQSSNGAGGTLDLMVDENNAIITSEGTITGWVSQGRMYAAGLAPDTTSSGLMNAVGMIVCDATVATQLGLPENITMLGPINFNNNKLSLVGEPTASSDAATKGYVDSKVLAFGPQTVASSAWAANTTYSAQGYGFRASVPLSGVTADHIPDVTFAMADAVSGNLAPLADTYMGGIYIYAKEQPSATVNIASVVCTKGA